MYVNSFWISSYMIDQRLKPEICRLSSVLHVVLSDFFLRTTALVCLRFLQGFETKEKSKTYDRKKICELFSFLTFKFNLSMKDNKILR